MKSHFRIALGGLLIGTPLAALSSGCGGGNSLGLPTATPTTTSTATPTATTAQATTQTSNFTLSNGQRVILVTKTTGTTITGTLQILAAGAQTATTRAVTNTFKVGTFQVTGTFTPPRSYSISVTDNGQPFFSMTGLLPTATQAGSYSLTVNGQTQTGVIPALGSPTATATPKPTTGPTVSPTTPVTNGINLTFAPSNPSNFFVLPLQPTQLEFFKTSLIYTFTGSDFVTAGGPTQLFVQGNLKDAVQGKVYNYTQPDGLTIIRNSSGGGSKGNNFEVRSGQITLTRLTATAATLVFKDVVYTGDNNETVKVNGTASANFTA